MHIYPDSTFSMFFGLPTPPRLNLVSIRTGSRVDSWLTVGFVGKFESHFTADGGTSCLSPRPRLAFLLNLWVLDRSQSWSREIG